MMKTPLTKKRIQDHLTYAWWKYILLIVIAGMGWAFLSKYIMGIHVLEPGCKKILFAPNLGGLEWVKGTYPTPYGIIEVSITKDGAEIIAPEGVEVIRK